MDFFSKLGAKAEETFQTIKESDTTKKAMNYAEIPGLSVQVGKQEGIIKKAYTEIGEKYYKAHKNDLDSDYMEQIKTIGAALKKIDELKKEIEEKKNYDPAKDNSKNVVNPSEETKGAIVVPSEDVTKQNQTVVQDENNWEV